MSLRALNNIYMYYRYCGCPTCVYVSVRSFLPPRASRPQNIDTYVFTATRKTLSYNYHNRDFCCKSFVQKLRYHLLASNDANYGMGHIKVPVFCKLKNAILPLHETQVIKNGMVSLNGK